MKDADKSASVTARDNYNDDDVRKQKEGKITMLSVLCKGEGEEIHGLTSISRIACVLLLLNIFSIQDDDNDSRTHGICSVQQPSTCFNANITSKICLNL